MSDLTKTPVQIILDMINEDNASGLTSADVSFGSPQDISADNSDRNTELTVNGVGGYSGSVDVRYNRISFDDLAQYLPPSFPKNDYTMLSDIVDNHFNALFGVNLQAGVDYVDVELPAFDNTPGESKSVVMTAVADSLVYIGSMSLTVNIDTVDIGDVITEQDLSGLNYVPGG